MSVKHNTKHNTKQSNYPDRLAARGLNKAPRMPTLASLCKEHDHRSHVGTG